ncbi:Na+/H+ antiporter NhaA [Coxiella endosymbiont of Amblyomma nuttalli]|uniref:Na+/H+ antiporter NhaA n=1 Tax=Coxiella endosymbiont of Amblyomma nuttalli TaxID=2749996 RepID=UPI001BA4B2BC|nr:Na+/H+ antiporter NhaA [Coxiella endosymbiont of Amblyomma nuttalli]QTS83620.1 Na(+)/H(+) antiporter NhaA [Coxiella endosymbiont of Amblyomma nuttalli]
MRFRILRKFIQLESSSGIILFVAAILALVLDNTSAQIYYESLLSLHLGFRLGSLHLSKPFLLWINDGLMIVFFLLVGLEVKREILEGELNSFAKVALPAIAGLGGMAVPALIYVFFNWGNDITLRGWAIPGATDIAFSMGILAFLRKRLPVALKIFLTTLAMFDDIGAIIIITFFYTHYAHYIFLHSLLIEGVLIFILILLNCLRVTMITAYVLVGIALWFSVFKLGVHATLAGIILAFAIPLHNSKKLGTSPLRELERKLHPWVAFGVLPVFAFANAGVSLAGVGLKNLLSPVTVGVALGLFLGKQLGIWSVCWLAIKGGLVYMPSGGNWRGIYGISLTAGVGFTMSLFIGTLAFEPIGGHYSEMARLGVIIGSFLSGVLGYVILRLTYPSN